MTQTVISAPPRTGKSLYCVELIETISRKEPLRRIYTNIIGIDIPGVISIQSTLNKPFDWRDLPNGSVLVYDEAHEHPAFSKENLLKTYDIDQQKYESLISQVLEYDNLKLHAQEMLLQRLNYYQDVEHPTTLKVKEKEYLVSKIRNQYKTDLEKAKDDILDIGRSLTLHGHFGIDIYLVTQKPDLLNNYVRAATSEHLILRRLFKMSMAVIYSYAEVQEQFGNATRKNALSWRIWFYPKRLYKYYISAESHPVKSKIPLALKLAVLVPFLVLGYAAFSTSNTDFKFSSDKTIAQDQTQQQLQKTTSSPGQPQVTANSSVPKQELTDFCRQGKNVETEQCKKFFDEISKQGLSIKPKFEYDPARPYDVVYHPEHEQPNDYPRFTNAVVYNGKCTAYSQQGTIMHNVTKTDCFRLANGDRPFDYFKNQNSQPSQVQDYSQQQTEQEKPKTHVIPDSSVQLKI